MAKWNSELVAERFREAAETARKLPGIRSLGYFSAWPSIQRERWEGYADPEPEIRFPATPEAIERLEETQRWVLWLEEPQRHLVWMRAEEQPWKEIARHYACDRSTAWRHWRKAVGIVARNLNGGVSMAQK